MALFQSKISWKIMRQRENKNYRSLSSLPDTQVGKDRERQEIKNIVSFRSYPTRNRKFQKNSKKIQKIKKQLYGFISSQYRLEKAEKERK